VTPPEVRGFSPIPLDRLPGRTIVVASADDPFVDLARAALRSEMGFALRECRPARPHQLGVRTGEWPEGRQLLDALLTGMDT
jgi:uncharacterized protein